MQLGYVIGLEHCGYFGFPLCPIVPQGSRYH